MKLTIEISYNDFKEICNTSMTIDNMYSTLNGRLYCAIAKVANSKEPSEDKLIKLKNSIDNVFK